MEVTRASASVLINLYRQVFAGHGHIVEGSSPAKGRHAHVSELSFVRVSSPAQAMHSLSLVAATAYAAILVGLALASPVDEQLTRIAETSIGRDLRIEAIPHQGGLLDGLRSLALTYEKYGISPPPKLLNAISERSETAKRAKLHSRATGKSRGH